MTDNENFEDAILAETEHYAVYLEQSDEGETVYQVDLDFVTLHLLKEEWDELVQLVRDATGKKKK